MNAKKILILSDTYLPLIGGAELYTYNLVQHLRRLNHVITIFTNTLTSGTASDKRDLNKNIKIIRQEWMVRKNLLAAIRQFFAIYKLAKRNNIVFANYTFRLSVLAAFAAKFAGKPFFIFAHGLGTIIDKGMPLVYYLYRFISLKLANGVIATSSEIAEIAKKYNKKTIVATAVDFSSIDNNLNENKIRDIRERFKGKKIILTVRRLVAKNGIQYLINTLPRIISEKKDIIYIIIGDGPMKDFLKELVNKLGLENYVVFMGRVENKEAFNYIKAADVVVFPSSAEAMSLAAIETMHIRTPLVATAVGGLKELIGEDEKCGQLINLFDRDKSIYSAPDINNIEEEKYKLFAEKIIFALSGGEEISRKTLLAKSFVDESFDWPVVAEKILKFCNID